MNDHPLSRLLFLRVPLNPFYLPHVECGHLSCYLHVTFFWPVKLLIQKRGHKKI